MEHRAEGSSAVGGRTLHVRCSIRLFGYKGPPVRTLSARLRYRSLRASPARSLCRNGIRNHVVSGMHFLLIGSQAFQMEA